MDQIGILYESILRFVLFMKENCGYMMFCDLNFFLNEIFVSS